MLNSIKRWFKRPRDPSGYVYYARLKCPEGSFYKLGYTTKHSLAERLSFGGHGDERLIDRELLFTYRRDAWNVEQILLDHFDEYRAFGKFSNDTSKPLAGRGQSELFAFDILGLDAELYRLTEKEREELKAEHAQSSEGCLMTLVGLGLAPFTLGISLFLIAGGLSGIFGGGRGNKTVNPRPKHPPKLQELIESLVRENRVRSEV